MCSLTACSAKPLDPVACEVIRVPVTVYEPVPKESTEPVVVPPMDEARYRDSTNAERFSQTIDQLEATESGLDACNEQLLEIRGLSEP